LFTPGQQPPHGSGLPGPFEALQPDDGVVVEVVVAGTVVGGTVVTVVGGKVVVGFGVVVVVGFCVVGGVDVVVVVLLPRLSTLNFDWYLFVPALVVATAVNEWFPFAQVRVSKPLALPLALVPAKSNGAIVSVEFGDEAPST
jgi:hypothetical protein